MSLSLAAMLRVECQGAKTLLSSAARALGSLMSTAYVQRTVKDNAMLYSWYGRLLVNPSLR
jgi:hypothetical protein